MIVFLTLIYVAILFAMLKTGIIKMNLWWKISPLVWMVTLFIVLFLPGVDPVMTYKTKTYNK